MVGISYRQKPQRRTIVELFGGEIHESPSALTKTGRDAMKRDPDRIGSLAVATGEAIELAREQKDSARFAVGSGETCVLLHQTVIGNEAVGQMAAIGDFPDYVVACMGAGSNFAGVGMPFLRAAKAMGRKTELVAAEPVACPKLTRGDYLFDINDFSGTTPVTRMYTLGSRFLAPPIHAGGLRYHGTSAFLSALYAHEGFSARAIPQPDALGAGILFADCEGIIPAPESAHAIAAAMEIAREHKTGPARTILINISGHGLFDLAGYEEARRGALSNDTPDEAMIAASLGAARAKERRRGQGLCRRCQSLIRTRSSTSRRSMSRAGSSAAELAAAFGVADHRFFREIARLDAARATCSPAAVGDPDATMDALVGLGEGCPNGGMLLSLGAHAFAVAGAVAKFADDGMRETAPAAARLGRHDRRLRRDRSQGRLRRDGDGDALRARRGAAMCSTARRPGSPTRPRPTSS